MSDEDEDEDGWTAGEDCDDSRADVHPGADEVPYDGVDQDCDGVDETDRDQDGWVGRAAGGADCDDADPAAHPDAVEVCGDLRDQDCDEQVDEGCEVDAGGEGITWVCGHVPGASGAGLGVLLVVLALRRRR